MKRKLDIVVLSDIHLGTHGCRAKELLNYLKSIEPEVLVLNGDIVDIWQFKKSFFPTEHTEVLRRILKMAAKNTTVYYITGNHDDALRKLGELTFGNIRLRDQLLLQIAGKKCWIFHGDVFDASIIHAPWLAKLGGKSYDLLIRFNRFANDVRRMFGYSNISFSAKIKHSVKSAVKHIQNFEDTAIKIGIKKGYDWVICGHIHVPQQREVVTENGKINYLNSGDWVESLTALEYCKEKWSLYTYCPDEYKDSAQLQSKDDELVGYVFSIEKLVETLEVEFKKEKSSVTELLD